MYMCFVLWSGIFMVSLIHMFTVSCEASNIKSKSRFSVLRQSWHLRPRRDCWKHVLPVVMFYVFLQSYKQYILWQMQVSVHSSVQCIKHMAKWCQLTLFSVHANSATKHVARAATAADHHKCRYLLSC